MKLNCLWNWLVIAAAFAAGVTRAGTLSVGEFLDEVKSQNPAVKASELSSQGSKERSDEGNLLFTPQLFANVNGIYDARPVLQPNFQPSLTRAAQFQIGVAKQFDFGLSAKFYQQVTSTNLGGVSPTILPEPHYIDTSPVVEVTQSLWKNGFGSESRAQHDLISASVKANQAIESFKFKSQLAIAEGAYWRLAIAREFLDIAKESLGRAGKIREWAQGRLKMDLADKTDFLQSDSNFKVKELELKSMEEEVRLASRAFNLARGKESNEVPEQLDLPDEAALAKLAVPARIELRDDTLAAKAQSEAAGANAQLGKEKNTPSLDLVASMSLTGRDPGLGGALGEQFGTKHPYAVAGLKFSTPLDFGLVKRNRAGYEKERLGAEAAYQKKLLDQEADWKDLVQKFEERRARIELVRKLEEAQRQKVDHERDRLRRAKTTTYQVLTFEDDYANSRRARLQLEGELLGIVTQMKLFGGEK